MSIIEPPAVDMDKLHAFVFRAVEEVGATLNAALVVMGDRLGLYLGLAGAGGVTPAQLAERLVLSVRTVDHHVSSVLGKLGARTRAEAATAAIRLGLTEDR